VIGLPHLVRRSLCHRWRSAALLALSLAVLVGLPALTARLAGDYERRVRARAAATPLVLTAPGSRLDAFLHACYFHRRELPTLELGAVRELQRGARGALVPLHARNRVRGAPLVGTDPGYRRHRGLRVVDGRWPLRVGECALGAELAVAWGLGPGNQVATDVDDALGIEGGFPHRLTVRAVVDGPAADRGVVFTTLATAWVVDGHGHGHDDAGGDDVVLAREEEHTTYNAALAIERDLDGTAIHFHADPDALPITAALAFPADAEDAALLRARAEGAALRATVPDSAVAELLGLVLRLRGFLDAQFAMVGGVAVLLLAAFVALAWRTRAEERAALRRLGASRALTAALFAGEWAAIAATAALLVAVAWLALLLIDPLAALLAPGD